MMQDSKVSIEENLEPKRRLLVPVKNVRTRERFCAWFASNAQFWSAEIRILSILEPLWFRDIPFSAQQAHRLLDEQAPITAQALQELVCYCQELRNTFPGISVSADVVESHINAGTVVDYARQWEADSILLLHTRKGAIQEFLENSLSARILRDADCMVHVVQTPSVPTRTRQRTRHQPSTT